VVCYILYNCIFAKIHKMKRYLLFTLLLLFSGQLFAQDLSNFKVLKDVSDVEVVFDYSTMKVLKDNYKEEDYIKLRTAELNKKLEESGDLWATRWSRAKEEIWQPKFLLLLNKYVADKVKFKAKASDSKYILKVKVAWVYPGWDAGVMKQAAKANTIITLYERANPSNVLVSELFDEMPGSQFGSNFSNESRLGESFAKTGKELGKMIKKRI
jgi:hypothetical protein